MRKIFTYAPPTKPADVLFSDDSLLVVDKPSGLLSVPGRLPEHKDSLLLRLQSVDEDVRLIHRLDMDTSGVMVFAKTAETQRDIGRQFEQRSVEKTYLAECAGLIGEDAGTVDLPLMADWPNRPLQKVDAAGKRAVTQWRVLARKAGSTVVELRPETGRSHQLRVHMAAMGHPMLGDPFYAPDDVIAQSDRLNLHAFELVLDHPTTGERLAFSAPCSFYVGSSQSRQNMGEKGRGA